VHYLHLKCKCCLFTIIPPTLINLLTKDWADLCCGSADELTKTGKCETIPVKNWEIKVTCIWIFYSEKRPQWKTQSVIASSFSWFVLSVDTDRINKLNKSEALLVFDSPLILSRDRKVILLFVQLLSARQQTLVGYFILTYRWHTCGKISLLVGSLFCRQETNECQ